MNLIMLYSYTVILIFFLHLHFITEEQHAAQVWWKNYLHASTHPIPHLLIPSIYLSRCADTQPLPNNEINTFNWVQAQLMSHVSSWLKIPPTLGRVAWLRLGGTRTWWGAAAGLSTRHSVGVGPRTREVVCSTPQLQGGMQHAGLSSA